MFKKVTNSKINDFTDKLQDYTDSPAEIYSTDSEEDLVILPSSRK